MASAAGSTRSWSTLAAIAAIAALRGFACTPDDGTPDDGFDRLALLEHLGEVVVADALRDAEASGQVLATAAAAWRDGGDRATAQQAWRDAMADWQVVEVLQVGPLGASGATLGGQDLRDAIYSWPTTNPCRVDQELVAQEWSEADFFSSRLATSYGLDALEHLLFVDGPDNVCPSQVPINSDGSWQALGEVQLDARRADFAAALAARHAVLVAEAGDAWERFLPELTEPGQAGGTYIDDVDALNAVFDAAFYVEKATKDRKLACPLERDGCPTDTGAAAPELASASFSGEAIAANLAGLRAVWQAPGLRDLLVHREGAELAEAVDAALDACDAALDALPDTLEASLVAQPDAVEAVHDAFTALGTLLKGDVAIGLLLQVPTEAAGDND